MVADSFLDLAAQGNPNEVEVRPEEKVVNALGLQNAATDAAR